MGWNTLSENQRAEVEQIVEREARRRSIAEAGDSLVDAVKRLREREREREAERLAALPRVIVTDADGRDRRYRRGVDYAIDPEGNCRVLDDAGNEIAYHPHGAFESVCISTAT